MWSLPDQIRSYYPAVNIDELRAFLAVADTGSFAAAARVARFARATLKRRIDELESRTGVLLFDRSGPKPDLTEAGALFAAKARELVSQTDELLAAVREQSKNATAPTFEFIVPPGGLPSQFAIDAMSAMTTLLPSFNFVARVAHDPAERLAEFGDLAWYVGDSPAPGPYTATRFRSVPLRLVATEEYLAKNGTPTTLDELVEHPLAVWAEPHRPTTSLPLWSGDELKIRPRVCMEQVDNLRRFAAAGRVIAFVPNLALDARYEPAENLVEVLPDLVGRDVGLWFLLAHRSSPASVVGRLLPTTLKLMSQQLFRTKNL